jgi:flagellar basal-body rod protein FlgB
MIDKILFGDDKLRLLKTALGAYSERGRVHSANVANAETPGYRARELRFEEDLQLALRTETAGKLAQTNSRHLPSGAALPSGKTVLRNPTSAVSGNGINDVEIDREMASIAENTVRYTVAAELVTRAYAQMKAAIRGRAIG